MRNRIQNSIGIISSFILGWVFVLFGTAIQGNVAIGGTTERVSVDSSGVEGNDNSNTSSINADGRYVVFESYASNLVTGDTNGMQDIFVHDRQTGITERVNVSSGGVQGNQSSYEISISEDGRYVAFSSLASNLVTGDTNGASDIFVRDRQTSVTQRVSLRSNGTQGNRGSWGASISANGQYVVFYSDATNLVSGDTNGAWDIFVRDRQTSTTQRVSLSSNGKQGNGGSTMASITGDGRYVAFISMSSNLVTGDTNARGDVFVQDRQTGVTQRVSVDNNGIQGNDDCYYSSISADGRYVAFGSHATNLVVGDTNGVGDVFVRDRQTGVTERVSVDNNGIEGNGLSQQFFMSPDGRYVSFDSQATNLVIGDTNGTGDVFVRDRQTGLTELVSISSAGVQGNDGSSNPSISADGRYVAFHSNANTLVADDTNGHDIFVRTRW